MTDSRTEQLAPGELETDAIQVRVLTMEDHAAIVRIDEQAMRRCREAYYETKIRASLETGTLHASLVAEVDDHVVGFVIARLYYGEFGHSEPVAVIDSVGVDFEYRRRKVGQALMRQLLMNLRAVGVEFVESIVDWERQELVSFLANHGFKPAPRLCLRLELDQGLNNTVSG